ncbi:MAG: hypothetical protein IJV35_02500 [Neisseriaceae bacterium]|nr:hypothetical protein [Neisseriaceae bacterium]MBR0129485.1 hypothetical protein [Neisseriaceae bacterium]
MCVIWRFYTLPFYARLCKMRRLFQLIAKALAIFVTSTPKTTFMLVACFFLSHSFNKVFYFAAVKIVSPLFFRQPENQFIYLI